MGPVSLLRLSAAGALAACAPALAHDAGGVAALAREPLHAWTFEAWVVAPLAAALVLYMLGTARLWRRAGAGRGVTRAHAARFAAGWLLLVAALVSPIDALGGTLFWAHMVQHELLMVGAAPLLVLSRPLEAWTWAIAPPWRRLLGQAARRRGIRAAWSAMVEPAGAWTLHALAIWAWHVPAFFEAGLRSEAVHALQHACFLASALLFWWSVFARGVRNAPAASVASLFTTMLHTGALGALLTFAPSAWYPHYEATALPGLSALEDQQLGGLVMWVPGGLAYLAAGLAVIAAWLHPTPAREA